MDSRGFTDGVMNPIPTKLSMSAARPTYVGALILCPFETRLEILGKHPFGNHKLLIPIVRVPGGCLGHRSPNLYLQG